MPRPEDIERRVAEVTAVLGWLTPGAPSTVPARVELAKPLFARYTAGGAEVDGVTVDRICRRVLADPEATAQERQAVGLIMPVLGMLAVFRPGAAGQSGPGGSGRADE